MGTDDDALGNPALPPAGTFGNPGGCGWLYVQNRASFAMGFCSVPSGGQGTGPWLTVPALSAACIPVDPGSDVAWQTAVYDNLQVRSMIQGSGSTQLLQFSPRTVNWCLLDSGGPMLRDLYPVETCIPISRGVNNLAAGASQIYQVCPPFQGAAGGTQALIEEEPVSAKWHQLGLPNPRDCCIVAVQMVILALGASSNSQQLTAEPLYSYGSQPPPSTFEDAAGDLQLFGALAAAGGAVATNSGIVPTGGCCAMRYTNISTTVIGFRASHWIAIPAP